MDPAFSRCIDFPSASSHQKRQQHLFTLLSYSTCSHYSHALSIKEVKHEKMGTSCPNLLRLLSICCQFTKHYSNVSKLTLFILSCTCILSDQTICFSPVQTSLVRSGLVQSGPVHTVKNLSSTHTAAFVCCSHYT